MEMIDWITLAIFTMIGAIAGWRVSAAFHTSLFHQILKDLGVTNAELIKVARDSALAAGIDAEIANDRLKSLEDGLEKVEIKVEKHGEMLYAFRADNDKFLGQGSTKDALIEAMKHHVSNVRCIVVEGDEYMKSEA